MNTDKQDNLMTDETAEGNSADESLESTAKKLPPNVEEVKSRRWLPYVIAVAVLAVFTLLIGWARGGFTETDTRLLLGEWSDAFSVPGILGLGFGLLVLGSNGGAFDMLSYGVKKLFHLFKKDPIDRKYGTFYEYQQARREKKRSFLYLVIVGGAYLTVGLILLFIYLNMQAPAEATI